jgi:hypothetical protein
MANGKQGDHPFTDIIDHGLQVYSPTADGLVREIVAMVSEEESQRLALMLWDEYNPRGHPDVPKLERVLTEWRVKVRDGHTPR